MLESGLDSPLDYGGVCNGNGAVPQWKRDLLQRRAARSFLPPPAPRAHAAPPAAATPPPPPLPSGPLTDDDEELRYGPGIVKRLKSRYLSLALRDQPRRRPSVLRRAASLEHLLEQPPAPPPPPPAPPRSAAARREHMKRARSVDALSRLERSDSREESPRPAPRAPRAPRRVSPLLSDAERPPPDVVRAALRKFESAPTRPRPAHARASAVLRGLARTPPRSAVASTQTTPSLRPRPPPPPCTSTPETHARSPSPATDRVDDCSAPTAATRAVSRAALDSIARAGASVRYSFSCAEGGSHLPALAAANPVLLGRVRVSPAPRQVGVIRPMPAPVRSPVRSPEPASSPPLRKPSPPPRAATPPPLAAEPGECAGGEAARRRAAPRAPAAAVSVVFNFSSRRDVPDYVENDGLVLRASRKDRLKAGDPGVVVLNARCDSSSDGDSDAEPAGPPSPCDVRFLNDNVLINGRSNLAGARQDPARQAKLKLQFDDSLTRTFEYPSESSLCEGASPAPPASPAHSASHAARPLGSYRPSRMLMQDAASAFQLGVTRAVVADAHAAHSEDNHAAEIAEEYLKPCAEAEGRAWSDSRQPDLLF